MSFGIKIKSVNITPSKILAKHGLGSDNKARKYLATSVAKYCDPYVPKELHNCYRFLANELNAIAALMRAGEVDSID